MMSLPFALHPEPQVVKQPPEKDPPVLYQLHQLPMSNHLIAPFEEMSVLKYVRPFKHPITVNNAGIKSREGLILTLKRRGTLIQTEAAPLPGLSQETIQDVQETLKHWPNITLYPSIQFALEWASIQPKQAYKIQSQALLWGSAEEIFQQFEHKKSLGFTTFKIKIARLPVDSEIPLIKTLLSRLAPNEYLRLDANKGWSLEQAIQCATAWQHPQLDYIEDPTPDPLQWTQIYQQTQVHTAIDEPLSHTPSFTNIEGLKAVILKPTILGFNPTIQIAHTAQSLQIEPILSSCFESSIGLKGIQYLAQVLNPNGVHGLDTEDFFELD